MQFFVLGSSFTEGLIKKYRRISDLRGPDMYFPPFSAVEIAAVGISIAIFNQVSKVAISPFVSITTSFVVEEETIGRINNEAVKVQITEKASMNKEETK
ncbi:hypothetical protein Tco_0994013 [Tanacetum coccineum]